MADGILQHPLDLEWYFYGKGSMIAHTHSMTLYHNYDGAVYV